MVKNLSKGCLQMFLNVLKGFKMVFKWFFFKYLKKKNYLINDIEKKLSQLVILISSHYQLNIVYKFTKFAI